MGATDFITAAPGKDAQEAFANARADAAYWHGHGGYSGTVYEKDSFVIISAKPMTQAEAHTMADQMIQDDDARISDKWGPAGAILLDTGEWLFFGWASC